MEIDAKNRVSTHRFRYLHSLCFFCIKLSLKVKLEGEGFRKDGKLLNRRKFLTANLKKKNLVRVMKILLELLGIH